LGPALRQQALATLLSRSSHVPAVLDAIETKRILAGEISSVQANFLRTYSDPTVKQRALRLLGPTHQQRPDVVALFNSALYLNGQVDRGRAIFLNRCAGCHSFEGQGQTFGPDLTAARIHGKEKLLHAILEPNAEVSADYSTSVIITREGENVVGTVAESNSTAVTLRQPHSVPLVWPRLSIQAIESQTWSLMPEGLERGLSPQNMADLLDYVLTAPQ
jgi:putative heme-binding domain-containing protein